MNLLFKQSLPYLIILLCAVLILGANPFNDETVAPTDILVNYPGWRNLDFDLGIHHPNRSDMLDARLPRWIQAKRSLRKGELPIWNPYPINGTPGLQWLPAAILTPAFAVFSSIKDDAKGYYFALLTNLLIAGTGAYLFLFNLTRNRYAATFGALIFAFNGFHAAWLYWAHITSSIWIPWIFLNAHGYLTTRKKVYLPGVTLTTALMIFGGFPTITVYALMALSLFSLVYAPWSEGVRSVIKRALLLSLFGLLALIITLFAIQSLHEMLQATHAMELRQLRGGTPLDITDLVRLVFPKQNRLLSVESTFYVGILPLVFLLISTVLLLTGHANRNLTAAFLILGMTVVIAFGLIPKQIVWAIPSFDSNSWNRMTILLALGFAVVSSEITSRLFTARIWNDLPSAPTFMFTLLLVIQFNDMRSLFQTFNGPVPASTFLPPTPTISYVQKHIQPLQSILADRIYLTSGTLTNYALPEWFAHGFKTPAEKAVLNSRVAFKAHVTNTAAMVECAKVQTASNTLDLLGIRYLLCGAKHSDIGRINILMSTSGGRHIASKPITPNNPLIQHFTLPNEMRISGLKLQMATHSKPQAHTDVTVKLYRDDLLLGTSTVSSANIHDNTWVNFIFPEPVILGRDNNRLEVHTKPTGRKGKLSVWIYTIPPGEVYIERRRRHRNAQVAAKFFTTVKYPKHYVEHQIEDGLSLIENTHVTGSGYALPELDPDTQPDFTHVSLISRTPTRVRAKYTGNQNAWLVLPIRLYPQWRAYINGHPAHLTPFMGMLPAVPVKPGDQVTYRYEPYRLYGLGVLSLITLLVTLYLTYRWRDRAN